MRNSADVNDSNAAQCKNEETQSEITANNNTNAGHVALSTTEWKVSCWVCEGSNDKFGSLVGKRQGTAHKQHRRSQPWRYSSDGERSDEDYYELWVELDDDDDNDCPY